MAGSDQVEDGWCFEDSVVLLPEAPELGGGLEHLCRRDGWGFWVFHDAPKPRLLVAADRVGQPICIAK
jgi:hypothetical protein